MANLTEEQKAAVENYGKTIREMKSDVEAIRTLPGMYVGAIGTAGMYTMLREIFQNADDQLNDESSPCDRVEVTVNENTLEVSVLDNGVGIPFNTMIKIFTKNHISHNYDKRKGVYLSSTNGIGAKVVNALSEVFIVESYKYTGEAMKIEMREGIPVTDKPVKIPNPNKYQGTKVTFRPSEIMGDINFKWEVAYNRIRDTVALSKLGAIVDFIAIDKKGQVHKEHIVNNDGIMYFIIKNTKSPVIVPIHVLEDTGEMRLNAMITWDAAALTDQEAAGVSYSAFCNYSPSIDDGSTNITGVVKGITSWFTDYMNKIYLANSRSKLKIIPNDVKTGLSLAIDSDTLVPIFTGQAKEKLSNEEMDPFCKEVVMRGLDEWSKTNPADLQKIAKFIQSIGQVRMNADKEKVKISANYESSAFSGLPAKYTKPTGRDHLELFICEGDSAKSPIVKCRDTKTQGIYPIRGKIISAFSHSSKEVFNNAEIQGILNILFGKRTYTPQTVRELSAKDCQFEKVIFTSDADVDGFHIASLLLRFFILYLPFLIEDGRVYKAVPPLYMIKVGNKKKFFTDNSDMVEYNQKEFLKKYTVKIGKNELTGRALKEFFIKNADYTDELRTAAANHALSPEIMEIVLMCHLANKKGKALEKEIKSVYRFVDYKSVNKIDVIKISDDNLYSIYCTDELISDCRRVLKIMKDNDSLIFNLNGEKASLYTVMNAYEKISPSGISRFKGLGEMRFEDLGTSTILPEERTLIRYTVESVKEEVATIRSFESNKKKLLDLTGTINRKDLIGL